jgi:pyruvate dehydrogenase (quinone)
MADRLVADSIVDRLRIWGVTRIFGYSGDGINTFLGALRRSDNGPEFVQARHEENAAFMAVAHSKFGIGQYGVDAESGAGIGVMVSTQGPGAVHLLNGLYDAKLDGIPVVAIVGQQDLKALGSDYQQEIDLPALFKDVAGYCEQISAPEQVTGVLDRAFRTALATSSPCVVIIPHNVQQMPEAQPAGEHAEIATAPVWEAPRVMPQDSELDAAAELLNASKRIVMLVGQGARHARTEVIETAERLGAALVTSLLGKPYVDESAPNAAGVMGHLSTSASAALLRSCDALLIVGSNDPWTEFYPAPGAARAVQIDISAQNTGNRYPVEVALVGDAALTLQALAGRLAHEENQREVWRTEVHERVSAWRTLCSQRALTPAEPVNPERVLRELSAVLPADAQVALDVGSVVYWYARQLQLPDSVPAHLCSTLASMGCGVPYGIAAKLLHPSRPVVVLAGDGGMQMSGVAELITVASGWKDWADPRFVVCVLNNGDLAEVTWEQRETEGDPRYAATQRLPHFPFAGYAELLGLRGIEVKGPDEIAGAWEQALSANRPVVIDVHSDASVPLLPPFPQGAKKLETMRRALAQEGESGGRALRLLNEYAAQEEKLFGH